jgi:hypothetical protein
MSSTVIWPTRPAGLVDHGCGDQAVLFEGVGHLLLVLVDLEARDGLD